MNTERIEQCKRDITALQAELAKLEAQTPTPRNGDIVVDGNGNRRIVILAVDAKRAYDADGSILSRDPEGHYRTGYYKRIGNVFDDYQILKD